ncbi:response regulator [Eisenbergiella sp.]
MKGYRKNSILILLSVAILLVFSMVFMLFRLNGINEKIEHSSIQRMLDSTRIMQSSIRNQFRNDEGRINSYASLYALRGGLDASPEILVNFKNTTDFFRFSYINMDGTGVDSSGNAVELASLPFEETALSSGQSGYSDAYIGSSGRLQITFQAPVWWEGEQIGALYADKTLSGYKDPSLFTFGEGEGHAFIVDGSGSWIIESTGTKTNDIYGFLEANGNEAEIRETLRELLENDKAGTIDIKFQGEDSILCFLPKGNLYHWYLLSVMPKSALQQESSEIIKMVVVSFLELAAALLLITVLLLSRETMRGKEQNRKYRERLFENISSNIDFAFLLYTPSVRKVEMVSENVRTLYDLEPEAIAARPRILFEKCGVPEDDEYQKEFLEGRLEEKIRKEYCTGTADELQRWTEIDVIPADNGQYLAVLHDTTREHHMREDLADALLQSQENNRARSTFFSSMSHDIRTPMNGIIGMTAIAQANLDNWAKVEDCLNKISSASDHLLSLINEVLDMSRIESGKFSLKCEPVNLPELISNVLLLIKPDLMKKNHMLQVKSTVLDYDIVMGDALHIQKILMNLLSNAIKYTPEGGKISISLQEKKRKDSLVDIIFRVEDNGIGMDPDFVRRIFSPFERAEDNRLSKVTGTGLGMAITKNIIDIMGGTISVESKPGAGSIFTVSLPLPPSEPGISREESLEGRTVLVVDDCPDTCEGIRSMLQEAGMCADCVQNGRDAVEAVRRSRQAENDYYAVIMDWKMPEMDGVEAARCIRAAFGADIPIILLSAYNWEEVEQEAIEAGINGFLTKPIFRSELLQKLRFYISGSSVKEQGTPVEASGYQFKGLHILLAEDNELNREIAMELLGSAGIRVDSVENGLQAVQKIEESCAGCYDLILMDIHMPVMDGLEATEKIRMLPDRQKAGIPIVAMTADAFREDVQKCKNAGMDNHISKPIEIEKMFDIIRLYYKKEGGGHGECENQEKGWEQSV